MSPMAQRFVEVGAPGHLAKLWFATLLRDGFALTAAGDNQTFATIGAEALRCLFTGQDLDRDTESAVQHVLAGFSRLGLHDDVAEGVGALQSAGYRLTTLTNGSTQVAEQLFTDAGIRGSFELLLSVEDAPGWKPGQASYHYAAEACGATAEQMLLVAVHPWDIHGASRAGLATAWLNRSGGRYPNYFQAPDHTVSSLAELAPALAMDPD
ncbi:haloacid dehalogenase type II [Pseudarthrobacter sp. NamB4]|nr:haloacid dehalogenase type II [Pseudarthrobacter sp. NamB4]